jgi:hypothetical protein
MREWICRVSGLILMNSAYQAELLNDVFSVLSEEYQSLPSKGNVSVLDLLSKNQPFSDKLEKLRTCQIRLISAKKGTIERLAITTEALNLINEIIQENWNEFPISVKEDLKKILSFSYFLKNIRSHPFKFILSIINASPLISIVFSKKPETRELNEKYQKSISDILSLCSDIQIHGHPSKHKNSKVPIESIRLFDTENEKSPSRLNSAEVKALNRLTDLDNPDQWVVAVTRDEKIDLEDLDKKIRERGYLV